MNERLTTLFLFVLAVVLVAFYWPWLSGSSSFYFEDTCNAFEPLCTYIGHSLAHLHLPLWDPYNYCGMSLIALPSPSVFYPPNLLFACLPYNQSVAVIMILSALSAAAGTYLLVRAIGWGWLPAMLAGGLISLSGYMFSFVNNFSLVATASWLPLCLLCVNRLMLTAERLCVRWCLLLSVCVALIILAGRPEISAGSLIVAAAYAVALRLTGHSTQARLILLAKAMCIGTLLAMPAILPAGEWLPISRRAGGLTAGEVLQFSAGWLDFLSLFVSLPLGNLQLNAQQWRVLVDAKNFPPYLLSAFVGYPALILTIVGVQKPGRWAYAAVVALLVGSIFCAAGGNVPYMQDLVSALPLLSALRFPEKLLFFVVLAVALFSARGLEAYIKDGASLKLPLLAAAGGLLAAVLLLFSSQVWLPFSPAPPAVLLAAQQAAATCLLIWSAIGLASALILWAGSHWQRRMMAAAAAASITLLSLLLHAFTGLRFAAPGNFFEGTPFIAEQLSQLGKSPNSNPYSRTMMLSLSGLSVPAGLIGREPLARSVSIYRYQRDLLKPFGNVDCHVPSPWGFDGPTDGEYNNFFINLFVRSTQPPPQMQDSLEPGADLPLYRLLQCTSTRYVITQVYRHTLQPAEDGKRLVRPMPIPVMNPDLFTLQFQDERMNARIYELKSFLPRAYLATNWSFADRDSVLNLMSTATAFDPQKKTILEGNGSDMPLPAAQRSISGQPHPAPGLSAETAVGNTIPVELQETDPEDIVIQADAPVPSALVLADQFYPGWLAEIDGQPAKILRANGFMRAVFLKPGHHQITFRYQPRSLIVGGLLSALGLLWAILLWRQALTATRLASRDADCGVA